MSTNGLPITSYTNIILAKSFGITLPARKMEAIALYAVGHGIVCLPGICVWQTDMDEKPHTMELTMVFDVVTRPENSVVELKRQLN